ncbi:DUF2973 domain-containing protein [Synechococcus sp. M16CYN]|uniref:DUF2973 domain-containing protein n=1 Tax=Synechococcus sp. M16CYN TaxID=3103139 RepID=UPI0033402A35
MLSALFPLIYGIILMALLWQAFRVMGKGFRAVSEPTDRTGRITVHPELLDSDGQITREDLLTIRFSGDDENQTEISGPRTE